MKILNARNWSRYSRVRCVAGSLIITAAALLVRFALHGYIEPFGVFHIFIISTLAVQYLYGYKYSIMVMVLSVLLGEYFFVKPYGEFSFLSIKDLIISMNFVAVTGVAIFMMERLQRLLYAQTLTHKVNESRQIILLQRENDRMYLSKKSNQSEKVLNQVLLNFEKILLLKFGQHPIAPGPAFYRQARMSTVSSAVSDWHQMIDPQDLERLLAPVGSRSLSSTKDPDYEFTLRFSQEAGGAHCKGLIEHLMVDGESLEIWLMSACDMPDKSHKNSKSRFRI